MKTTAIGLHPMHQRPPAGRGIIVQMRDGRQLECSVTLVRQEGSCGIVIYYRRRAIDESKAVGWWPKAVKGVN